MKTFRNKALPVLALGLASLLPFLSTPASAVTMLTMPIGNLGNAPDSGVVAYNGMVPWDTTTHLGAVNYAFSIGLYEVTAGQYTDFLNAVAATDTHSLYATQMANPAFSGITRSGGNGNYSYAVNPANANRPVQFISYWDATRFANWMHNGQPVGAQVAGITETGSYTLTPAGIAGNTVTRNAGATWVLPSEDEWYKAAYYNPGTGTYWTHPTQSNAQPGNNLLDPLGNNANLAGLGPYPAPIDGIHFTTAGGQFQNSAGPYGTYDFAGNVYEWNEGLTTISPISGLVGRGLRGGSFGDDATSSSDRSLFLGVSPSYSSAVSGFRVALVPVPEPSTLSLLAVGALVLGWRWRAAQAKSQKRLSNTADEEAAAIPGRELIAG